MSTQAVEFTRDAVRVAADLRHRTLIHTAMGKYEVKRDEKRDLFQDWPAARQLAAERKWEAVNHLDRKNQIQIFRTPVFLCRLFNIIFDNGACGLVPSYLTTGFL